MSKIDDGGPGHGLTLGMTLRDHFAGMALGGCCADPASANMSHDLIAEFAYACDHFAGMALGGCCADPASANMSHDLIAEFAYACADAMIRARLAAGKGGE